MRPECFPEPSSQNGESFIATFVDIRTEPQALFEQLCSHDTKDDDIIDGHTHRPFQTR